MILNRSSITGTLRRREVSKRGNSREIRLPRAAYCAQVPRRADVPRGVSDAAAIPNIGSDDHPASSCDVKLAAV